MAVTDLKELKQFLKPFSKEVQETAFMLREFIWKLYPECNELIYDNYNAVAVCWSLTDKLGDAFISFAVYGSGVNLGFNRGSEIDDTENILSGSGSLYRFVRVNNEDFPKVYIKKLIKAAYLNSAARLKTKNNLTGMTMVKSISPVKKRPAKKSK